METAKAMESLYSFSDSPFKNLTSLLHGSIPVYLTGPMSRYTFILKPLYST